MLLPTLCLALALPAQPDRSGAVRALLDDHYEWSLREDPVGASTRGDDRWNHLLRDESPEAYARRANDIEARLRRVEALAAQERERHPEDSLDLRLLAHELQLALEGRAFHPEQLQATRVNGPQVWLPQLGDSVPFTTPRHYEDYLARLAAMAAHLEQITGQLRDGLAAGRTPPRIAVVGADVQALRVAAMDAEACPLLTPLDGLGKASPLRARGVEIIRDSVLPAMRRLGEFLRDEYIPGCRESIALSEGVDGLPAYEHALRAHTTLPLSAKSVHDIGLSEVARIRGEMLQVIARSDYPRRNDLKGDDLLAAFLEYLRTDPRFYHTRPEDLLAGYRDICKRMDAELPKLFGVLPRLPYGVREMPAHMAEASPTAYYYNGSMKSGVSGTFIANTHRLDQRPRYEMVALALHEAVPGHHLQLALADERSQDPSTGLHPFRGTLSYTAYVEGWALYAERLGLEVGGDRAAHGEDYRGFYQDPYDDFGRLTYEMWRASRLVVDTGMHALGWSRQQAISFMVENTGLSRHNIEAEVDRYIGWPGQACAYKLGELSIRSIRSRAERSLGERFDLRAFHDHLLGAGALPLPELDRRMDAWISDQKSD